MVRKLPSDDQITTHNNDKHLEGPRRTVPVTDPRPASPINGTGPVLINNMVNVTVGKERNGVNEI